jgi:hypothetical protein
MFFCSKGPLLQIAFVIFTTSLFYKPLPVYGLFFFALMQKRTKKNQGKTRSLRAFLPSHASPCVTAYVFAFYLVA